ncbi:MAG: SIR2 family protein [Fimbriimonadaceae bacterium]|nr:SIR2 family protein [Alphaproteobacteria bacterium]
MRFIENGPNIPDELLEARDKGEVIFICGAGISIPAGLPSFAALAKGVVSDLGVSKSHRAHLLLDRALNAEEDDYTPPMDQIFNLLKKDYGALVQQAVFKRLSMPKGASLIHHKTILDLSADVNGNPRLITTNFDLLFEGARKRIRKYIAPELPDFTAVQKFEGIVYLHGRLPTKGSAILGESSIILSSSDFGRAYLSQGWAARFIRDLLQRFTVVLLGYSATDPPIRYLLEGLETSAFDYRHRIFTFDSGTPKEVDARWRDRNVRGIAYTNKDKSHEALWKSLHAWAERAKDPIAWRKSVIEISQKGPANLSAFERGQVVSLVSSVEGAKAFAEEANPPPPEWICVFDYNSRYAEPYKGSEFGEKKPPFDPLAVFGLALQLFFCLEVRALSDRLVSSAPE